MRVTKGLFIKPRWINLILDGTKTWEMRATSTKFRGWFALVGSGTGCAWGVAKLVGVERPKTPSEMIRNFERHRIPEAMIMSREVSKWNTPWVIGEAMRLPEPIRSTALGQIWVNLEPDTIAAIENALSGERS